MPVIHKIAALVIENDRLLLVRKEGRDIWTSLGGKPEIGETEEQALLREIKEELGCEAQIDRKIGDFMALAVFDPGSEVKLSTYLVKLQGEAKISDHEIVELIFIGPDHAQQGIKLPSSLQDQIIPYCIENGILKWGKEKYIRPTWDEYFMEICRAVAKRATCDRGRSGCVIARNNQILVTGYVGAPRGIADCDEVGHQMKTMTHEDGHQSHHCVRGVHAEQNAIVQAARVGVSIEGATLYCKMTPCATCAKMIVNSGIKKVICEKKYHAGDEETLSAGGVTVSFFDENIEKYANQ
ncbi:MAG: dCMP deaminase [uncultured bacterium]|nr:MAG: dCMP deaminase [uncultured bacterium]